ncbi:unnamed protein product [Monosporozyma servazzii]
MTRVTHTNSVPDQGLINPSVTPSSFVTYKTTKNNKKQKIISGIHSIKEIPEVAKIDTGAPIVGTRLERSCMINGVPQKVLFDTGSPTSLVSADLVRDNHWTTYDVPVFTWTGALKDKTSSTTDAVRCELKDNDRSYNFGAYVSSDLHDIVIVGNPIITHYPELLRDNASLVTTAASEVANNKNNLTGTPAAIDCKLDAGDTVVANRAHFVSTIMSTKDLKKGDIVEVFVVQVERPPQNSSIAIHELPSELKDEFKETVSDVLPPRNGDLTYTHEIELEPGKKPPRLPPYRMTPLLEKECRAIIKEFIEKDFIQESKSPVSSPVLLVKKKDGSYRLVVDYRQLNAMTIKDPFPLPRIDDLIAKIGDCSVFSTLDLHSGYHQIPMDPDSAPLTAFSTPFGHWEFKAMSMGLCNAPAKFSRYM